MFPTGTPVSFKWESSPLTPGMKKSFISRPRRLALRLFVENTTQFNSIQSPLFKLGKWISRAFFQRCLVTITSLLTIITLAQEFTILSIPIDSYKRDYLVFMLSKTNTNKNSNNLKYRYIITRNES